MKAIMVMYDTLIRRMLPPYGCQDVIAPNFSRLAERTVTFDRFYAGSLPCMPARRELHTGRYNFLHRSWGPVEPFDDSMPELLAKNGIYTHLVTDHGHYFEDGGATYHNRYSSWEGFRGQEGDKWKAVLGNVDMPDMRENERPMEHLRLNWINRMYQQTEQELSSYKTFEAGLEFIEKNHGEDGWFLQIESFDPHEPFYVLEQYIKRYEEQFGYKDSYAGAFFDWPIYGPVTEEAEAVAHIRFLYKVLITMCDKYLGKVLDAMDRYDLWKDTMLIVNTDHGFLLGEHEQWGKNIQPMYDELVHIPCFIWDPRIGDKGTRRSALTQTIDLVPTLLEYFNVEIPENVQGHTLRPVLESDEKIHDGVLFGIHGGHVNVTDGRYVYMRASGPENTPLYEYTLMPTHMIGMFGAREFEGAVLCRDFKFTKSYPVMKLPSWTYLSSDQWGTMLFDLLEDPSQQNPIDLNSEKGRTLEEKMIVLLKTLMKASQAPKEQYERLGLC